MKTRTANLLLAGGAVVLVVVSLALGAQRPEGFAGSDERAKDEIVKIRPDYRPWFASLWVPPGAEIESLLFALQAALGAGAVAYVVGYRHGLRRSREKS